MDSQTRNLSNCQHFGKQVYKRIHSASFLDRDNRKHNRSGTYGAFIRSNRYRYPGDIRHSCNPRNWGPELGCFQLDVRHRGMRNDLYRWQQLFFRIAIHMEWDFQWHLQRLGGKWDRLQFSNGSSLPMDFLTWLRQQESYDA
jgi:hypothetical protein